jgi:hypothetical protein
MHIFHGFIDKEFSRSSNRIINKFIYMKNKFIDNFHPTNPKGKKKTVNYSK